MIPQKSRQQTILAVDDSASVRLFHEHVLRAAGYLVEVASNGTQAVERVKKGGIDLIILDQYMPELRGNAALREIRGIPECGQLPVLLISAEPHERLLEAFRGSEPIHFLGKPMSTKQIRAEIDRILGPQTR
jgi:CheY-like chemotaxis protein